MTDSEVGPVMLVGSLMRDLQTARLEGAREALTRLMQKCEQGAFGQFECDCGVDMTDLPTREDIRAFRDSEFPLPSPRTETME